MFYIARRQASDSLTKVRALFEDLAGKAAEEDSEAALELDEAILYSAAEVIRALTAAFHPILSPTPQPTSGPN